MGNVRGLRTRLCPKCEEVAPHRTLYVRTTTDGRRTWFQIFWACQRCGSLNHIVLPAFSLDRVASQLPSTLTVAVISALKERALDLDELLLSLRRTRIPGVPHVFNSDVAMALEFLKGRGVVKEGARDRTEKVLESLKTRSAESIRLGACPVESNLGVPRAALVSLYAQRQTGTGPGMRLVPAGALCPRCGYHQIDL